MIYLFIFGCTGSLAAWAVFPVAASGGSSLVAVHGLLIAVASFVMEPGLQGTQASVVEVPGLHSCSFQALEHRLNS